MTSKTQIKGYKVFNSDFTCRDFQYEIGKTYTHKGKISLCNEGFHFCQKLMDCFNYYPFNPENKVAEVLALGKTIPGDDKSVTNKIEIVRELSWHEVLELVNTGKNNSGNRNSGNCNSGYRNSGNCNSGYRNSGNRNSGNWNSATGTQATGTQATATQATGTQATGTQATGTQATATQATGTQGCSIPATFLTVYLTPNRPKSICLTNLLT